jgi:hypothetical protein
MRLAAPFPVLCSLLVCGGCVLGGTSDPPALPDATRFVPPPVTQPVEPRADPAAGVAVTTMVLPVRLPPAEAVPTVRDRASLAPPLARRKHGHPGVEEAIAGSLLTPTRGGFADNTSAILRYPYRTGAVYYVPTSPAHPTSLLLPPGVVLAANPAIDDSQWDVQGAKMQVGDELQFAVVVQP